MVSSIEARAFNFDEQCIKVAAVMVLFSSSIEIGVSSGGSCPKSTPARSSCMCCEFLHIGHLGGGILSAVAMQSAQNQ